jgi:hypothetical protein
MRADRHNSRLYLAIDAVLVINWKCSTIGNLENTG